MILFKIARYIVFYDKSEIEVDRIAYIMAKVAVLSAAIILLTLFIVNDAYAHGVRGGFYSRQPDLTLAVPMLAAAAFGIFVVVVRSVRMILGVGLMVGSVLGFAWAFFELARLGNQIDAFTPETRLYYYSLGGLIVASAVAFVGGVVVTAYYMIARYRLVKRQRH